MGRRNWVLRLATFDDIAAIQRQALRPPLPTLTRQPRLNTDKMPGVGVKDIESHKFINAYAAFLKRQGKLPM